MIRKGTCVEYLDSKKEATGIIAEVTGYCYKNKRFFIKTRNGHVWMVEKKNLKVVKNR